MPHRAKLSQYPGKVFFFSLLILLYSLFFDSIPKLG